MAKGARLARNPRVQPSWGPAAAGRHGVNVARLRFHMSDYKKKNGACERGIPEESCRWDDYALSVTCLFE